MTHLYHPICQLVNGERLYYALVAMRASVLEATELIERCMQDAGIENSYCAYATFGTSDLLIRVWALETKFAKFRVLLAGDRRVIGDTKVYVIDSMSTWYQREMEKRAAWPPVISDSEYDRMMQHKIRDVYTSPVPVDAKNTKKYFMFVEKPYTTRSTLFDEIKTFIEKDENSKKKKYFVGIHRMSVYSYQAKAYQGILIKGQTTSLKMVYQMDKKGACPAQ